MEKAILTAKSLDLGTYMRTLVYPNFDWIWTQNKYLHCIEDNAMQNYSKIVDKLSITILFCCTSRAVHSYKHFIYTFDVTTENSKLQMDLMKVEQVNIFHLFLRICWLSVYTA